jgi:hypothetical protein
MLGILTNDNRVLLLPDPLTPPSVYSLGSPSMADESLRKVFEIEYMNDLIA